LPFARGGRRANFFACGRRWIGLVFARGKLSCFPEAKDVLFQAHDWQSEWGRPKAEAEGPDWAQGTFCPILSHFVTF